MITFLHGRLTRALPTQAIVDVGGVGYEVFIPLSSYDKLPAPGESVQILTHLHVREDAQILYGFMTAAERDLFRLLVNHVSGHQAGVAGVYNKAQYLTERRQALTLWGAHIAAIAEDRTSKVVPMRA